MEVRAKARYIRISPRKVRLVLDAVRGMKAKEAVIHLSLMPQKAARPVKKLVESAIANAVNNFKLNDGDLRIIHLTADEGPTIKRWRARAFGRAAMIRKRTTHISVIVSEVDTAKKSKKDTAKKGLVVKQDKKAVVSKKSKTTKATTTKKAGTKKASANKAKKSKTVS